MKTRNKQQWRGIPKRVERTSLRIGQIAARVLAAHSYDQALVNWTDIRALAASCLTQLPDKVKRKLWVK